MNLYKMRSLLDLFLDKAEYYWNRIYEIIEEEIYEDHCCLLRKGSIEIIYNYRGKIDETKQLISIHTNNLCIDITYFRFQNNLSKLELL